MVAAIETRNRDAGSTATPGRAFQPHTVPGRETRPANGGTVVLEAPGMPEGFVVTDARRAGGTPRLVLPDGWTVTDARRAIGKAAAGKPGKAGTGDARPCQVPGCANHVPATWAAWWRCCNGCWDKAMLARFGVKLKKDLDPYQLPEYAALNAAVRAGGFDWGHLIP